MNINKSIEIDSWDKYFMEMLPLVASRSPDINRKFGCIIVRDHRILCTGYNGHIGGVYTAKFPITKESTVEAPLGKHPVMVHAEINAITDAARRGISLDGGIAYISTAPCLNCFQTLWQSGIREIVYPKRAKERMIGNYKPYWDMIKNVAGDKLIIRKIDIDIGTNVTNMS